jgi:lipoate-protein ligase A
VRIYGWKPAAVSIGYAQRAPEVIDLKKCARQSIPVVRRLTGGRAVLHDQEVTYSVVAQRSQWDAPASVLGIYKRIGRALVVALQQLGIRARLSRSRPDGTGWGTRVGNPQPCFSSTGRYEVLAEERKLVGSAQRWLGEVVLQHGSILLSHEHARLATLLPDENRSTGQRAAQRLSQRTISLSSLLSRRVSYKEVSAALQYGFAEVLEATLRSGRISLPEQELARSLVRERYGRLEWTLRAGRTLSC